MPLALRAGAAEIDITPPMGIEMCGYGPYEKRICTEVLDPLYARALYLESGGQSLIIVAVDLCTIDRSIRDAVAQEVSQQRGVPAINLMIAASHTHSGPAAQLMIGWGERDFDYLSDLQARLVRLALEAHDSAGPAKVGAARRKIKDVGLNREQPDIGPIDAAAQLMRVDREDGSPLAVMFNFGAHPVVRYPFTSRISADWPGLVAGWIRFTWPAAVPLFLQGPCANVNAHDMTWHERASGLVKQQVSDMRAGDVAQRFSDQILPALEQIQTQPQAQLEVVFKTVELPCVAPDEQELKRAVAENSLIADGMTLAEFRPLHQRQDETESEAAWRQARFEVDSAHHQLRLLESPPYEMEAPVQVMRIGDAAIVGWPGEIFVELGLELRQRSPFPLTFVAAGVNHTVGYIPTLAAFESQGRPNQFGEYPTRFTPRIYGTLPFRSDVGTILLDETLDILNGLLVSRQG